jgi:hypothetical protein
MGNEDSECDSNAGLSLRCIIRNIKALFKKDKKKEAWHDKSDEVADKLRQINDNLKRAQGIMANVRPDDKKIAEWGQVLGQYSKPTETALETYGKAVKSVDFLVEVNAKIKEFNSIDLVNDPNGGAKKFDEIFAYIGKLGDYLPDGPWKMYFDFMKGFKGGFFGPLKEKIDKHYNDAWDAAHIK